MPGAALGAARSLLLATSLVTGFVPEQIGPSATFVARAAFTAPVC